MTANPDIKRLYKSRADRMIDGVCGGIAEYFALDATLVRIAWVLLTFLGGSGIILYIAAMIFMPVNPSPVPATAPGSRSNASNSRFWGFLLVAVGILWLMSNLGFPFWHHWWWLGWDALLPVLLILAGVAFLFGGRNYVSATSQSPQPDASGSSSATPPPFAPSRLYRSRTERKFMGVCGGIGMHVNADPTIIRILFIIGAFASFGIVLLLYIVMAIIVPEEPLVSHVQ